MSEDANRFRRFDYYTTVLDEEGNPVDVKVTDMSDEDFRRWLMWKLPRLAGRRPRPPPKKAKKKAKEEVQDSEVNKQ